MDQKKKTKKDKEFEKTIRRLTEDHAARIEAVRKSHLLFFHVYLARYVTYKTADFQREIFNISQNKKIQKAVIVAFRESGKSSIISTSLPLWSILGEHQRKHVLIFSQTQNMAQRILRDIKDELENNKLLKRDLGPFREEPPDQWGMQALVLNKFNARISVGSLEQGNRGTKYGPHRPDLIILDDMENTMSVRTQESRDKVWTWLTQEIIPMGNKDCRYVAVGNLLHRDSLLKRMEAAFKKDPARCVYKEYPIVKENGEPMWPGKFPEKEDIEMERLKIMDKIAWHREYMLEIIADDDQIVKEEWILSYDQLPDDDVRKVYISIDPAISEKQTGDYCAMIVGVVCGFGDETKLYILGNMVNKRLGSMEKIIAHGKALADGKNDWPRAKFIVEGNGFQKLFVDELEKRGCDVYNAQNYTQDKRARLFSVANLLERGKVFFPKTGAEQLINQILGFKIEKHDDLLDAFTMLLSYASRDDFTTGSGPFGTGEVPEWNTMNSRQIKMWEERGYRRPVPERQLKPEYMRPVRHGQRSNRLYEEDDFF